MPETDKKQISCGVEAKGWETMVLRVYGLVTLKRYVALINGQEESLEDNCDV